MAEIQAPNVLGSYIQGLEYARANKMARMQEAAAMQEAQREAQLRNFLSTADLTTPEAQNALLKFGKPGAEMAKTLGEMSTQALTRKKTELEIGAAERKNKIDQLSSVVATLRGALKDPASYQLRRQLAAEQGLDVSNVPETFDPNTTPQWIQSQIDQLLPIKDQLELEHQDAQLGLEKRRTEAQETGVGLERRRLAVTEAKEAREAREAGDKSIVARTETSADGTVRFYNKFGDLIKTERGAGKPSGAFEKSKIAREETQRNISEALSNLKEIVKPGGLIEKSTGSGLGRARDVTAGFFGKATEGAIAAGQLAPLADQVLKLVPRFEGPQSDKDTQSYREAAGQLADSTLPNEIRKAAANTIIKLFERRQNQFTMQGAELESSPSIDALLDKYK